MNPFQQAKQLRDQMLSTFDAPAQIMSYALSRMTPMVRSLKVASDKNIDDEIRVARQADKERQMGFDEASGPEYLLDDKYNFGPKKIKDGKPWGIWATNPDHVPEVKKIHAGIKHFKTEEEYQKKIDEISNYIDKKTIKKTKSPLTAKMILDSARKYDVDPAVLFAELQQDSGLGRAGKGVETKNPANVGNDDTGKLVSYKTWEEGVDAGARELARRELNRFTPRLLRRINNNETVRSHITRTKDKNLGNKKESENTDEYKDLRFNLEPGEILVEDKKGNIGGIPLDEFDENIYTKI